MKIKVKTSFCYNNVIYSEGNEYEVNFDKKDLLNLKDFIEVKEINKSKNKMINKSKTK